VVLLHIVYALCVSSIPSIIFVLITSVQPLLPPPQPSECSIQLRPNAIWAGSSLTLVCLLNEMLSPIHQRSKTIFASIFLRPRRQSSLQIEDRAPVWHFRLSDDMTGQSQCLATFW
jgi:hypothetical protein